MTLSSLQAQASRVILSGFSPSNCTEKTKRKPACQTCQLRARENSEVIVAPCLSLFSPLFATRRPEVRNLTRSSLSIPDGSRDPREFLPCGNNARTLWSTILNPFRTKPISIKSPIFNGLTLGLRLPSHGCAMLSEPFGFRPIIWGCTNAEVALEFPDGVERFRWGLPVRHKS